MRKIGRGSSKKNEPIERFKKARIRRKNFDNIFWRFPVNNASRDAETGGREEKMYRNVVQSSRKPLAARLTDTRDVTFKMILTRAIRILAPLRPPPPPPSPPLPPPPPILHLPVHTRGADS